MRRFFAVVAVAAVTLMVAACGSESVTPVAATSPELSAPQPPAQVTTVILASEAPPPASPEPASNESASLASESVSESETASAVSDDDAPTMWKSQLFAKQAG